MKNDSDSTRREKMQKAISNEMTRNELGEFLSDPSARKEFFELMKLKNEIGLLNEQANTHSNVTYVSSFQSKRKIFDFKNPLLAAASVLILSLLAIYFMFFRYHRDGLSISKSVTTGDCFVDRNPNGKEILFKAGKNSFCDYKTEGDLGLTLRLLPNSEFSVFQNEDEADLNLNYGIVLFTTHKNRSSLRIRSKVKNLSSELLGTTLVLIADPSVKRYQILVLEGAIRVKDPNFGDAKPEVRVGFEVVKDDPAGTQSASDSNQSKIQISKIEPNTFIKYKILSEIFKSIVDGNTNANGNTNESHDEKTVSILRKETGSADSSPIFKIVLKNGKNFLGSVEETDRFYILTDREGKKFEIDKKEIEELELIPPEN
ncbi:LIMLP_03685 family anti-sigma factor [Leptospira kmetyi]|uniref:LIMLP_03685 family anti-sigma factor n=1 Tax=Leptospira kmetyi TaxID=408139 RepID=UPI001083819B|nr:iron dicitrate transport regulator FecR [Leptospira kmetyi]TGK19500.1 iron dicitrate transport regulator FecR [Leptospira kmetyi]TGK26441.1 iron dicitrate transport regulator FecR [Leptospira kmetyi]